MVDDSGDRVAFRGDADDPLQVEYDKWWQEREDDDPTVIVRCGRDGCRKAVGELKADGDAVFILWHHRFGEATASRPEGPPNTFEPIRRKLYGRDSQPLRDLGAGRRVTKRYRAEPLVRPLKALSYAVCPDHGVLPLDYPDERIADLRAFVGDTQQGSRRSYFLFREKPLGST
jgi:hypothetical protein